MLADYLTAGLRGRLLVMLSGPSSSGKTTTALRLCEQLSVHDADAHVVSLDDFYRGRGLAPRLPDGSFDYESPEALDLDRLSGCMRELVRDGKTRLPRYDFEAGRPDAETRELRLSERSVVIFEGIHALHPVFSELLPQENLRRVFINTLSPIYDGGEKCLARRDIRLVRRLLRDERFRNSPPENTLRMWQQVMRGETTYLFPYTEAVDAVIDTTHAYEPCVFAGELLPLLREVPAAHPQAETARHLCRALEGFEQLPSSIVPADSILREFLG